MAGKNAISIAVRLRSWQELAPDYYGLGLAAAMMLLGLRHWAIIMGMIDGPGGGFEAMSTPWKVATMHFAVADPVASVGLWMRVSWGRVMWIYAAVSEIAVHTVFIDTFGGDIFVVIFHLVSLSGYAILLILARRQPVE